MQNNARPAAGNDPDNQWALGSSMDLPHDVSLDLAIRHVAALPDPIVPAYTAFDARLAWPRTDPEPCRARLLSA